jgi:hypothetical protein
MLVSVSCDQKSATTNTNGNANSSVSTAAAPAAGREMEVTILFSGLMVLNKKSDNSFEMGILSDPDVQKEHEFCVRQASASKVICRKDMQATGIDWRFIVRNQAGGAPPSATPVPSPYLGAGAEGPRPKRRPDDEAGQYDFNWIINFDGPEFHGEKLELLPGHLNPIIQLPGGQFFTRHKSYDLIRTKGGTAEDKAFGFVAETTGLRLTLQPGQELVLLDGSGEKGKDGKKILSVPYAYPYSEIVSITNVRPEPSEESDFGMYYNLFKPLDKSEHYDFARNKNQFPCPGSAEPCHAHNMVPHDERWEEKSALRTCCAIDCTKIYLSRSGRALQ